MRSPVRCMVIFSGPYPLNDPALQGGLTACRWVLLWMFRVAGNDVATFTSLSYYSQGHTAYCTPVFTIPGLKYGILHFFKIKHVHNTCQTSGCSCPGLSDNFTVFPVDCARPPTFVLSANCEIMDEVYSPCRPCILQRVSIPVLNPVVCNSVVIISHYEKKGDKYTKKKNSNKHTGPYEAVYENDRNYTRRSTTTRKTKEKKQTAADVLAFTMLFVINYTI